MGTRSNRALQVSLSSGKLVRQFVDSFDRTQTNLGTPASRKGLFAEEPLNRPTIVPTGPLLLDIVDGEKLITASSHGFLRAWDTRNHVDSIFSVPDVCGAASFCTLKVLGRLFAFVGSWDSVGIMQVDVERRQVVKVIQQQQPGTWVTSIRVMEDKRTLVVASSLGPVRIWDAPSGKALGTLVHPDGVTVSQVVVQGSYIFTSGSDGAVRKWRRVTENEFEHTLAIEVQHDGAPAVAVAKVDCTRAPP